MEMEAKKVEKGCSLYFPYSHIAKKNITFLHLDGAAMCLKSFFFGRVPAKHKDHHQRIIHIKMSSGVKKAVNSVLQRCL